MDKLPPVGYIRGDDSGISQIEHFDNVAHYVMTIRDFVKWLSAYQDIDLVSHPASSRHQSMPPLQKLLDEYFEIDAEQLKQERQIQTAHRRHAEQEYPRCVNCKQGLTVYQHAVYLPEELVLAPTNYFGGYVCSESCDTRYCLDTLTDMNDLDMTAHAVKARRQIEKNWPK